MTDPTDPIDQFGRQYKEVRLLTDAQASEVAEHVAAIDSIWSRMKNVKKEEWIPEDLGAAILVEIGKYVQEKWSLRLSAIDVVPISMFLRRRAEDSQAQKEA